MRMSTPSVLTGVDPHNARRILVPYNVQILWNDHEPWNGGQADSVPDVIFYIAVWGGLLGGGVIDGCVSVGWDYGTQI